MIIFSAGLLISRVNVFVLQRPKPLPSAAVRGGLRRNKLLILKDREIAVNQTVLNVFSSPRASVPRSALIHFRVIFQPFIHVLRDWIPFEYVDDEVASVFSSLRRQEAVRSAGPRLLRLFDLDLKAFRL